MKSLIEKLNRGDYAIAGWQEVVRFPSWQNAKMKAKIDTGARSSAIHAEEYEILRLPPTETRPVNEVIRMKLKIGSHSAGKMIWAEAPIVDYRNVKNSGGKIEERPFVEATIEVGEKRYPIVLSVTNREKMRFPVLLGRTFLSGKFLVDAGTKNSLKLPRTSSQG